MSFYDSLFARWRQLKHQSVDGDESGDAALEFDAAGETSTLRPSDKIALKFTAGSIIYTIIINTICINSDCMYVIINIRYSCVREKVISTSDPISQLVLPPAVGVTVST